MLFQAAELEFLSDQGHCPIKWGRGSACQMIGLSLHICDDGIFQMVSWYFQLLCKAILPYCSHQAGFLFFLTRCWENGEWTFRIFTWLLWGRIILACPPIQFPGSKVVSWGWPMGSKRNNLLQDPTTIRALIISSYCLRLADKWETYAYLVTQDSLLVMNLSSIAFVLEYIIKGIFCLFNHILWSADIIAGKLRRTALGYLSVALARAAKVEGKFSSVFSWIN